MSSKKPTPPLAIPSLPSAAPLAPAAPLATPASTRSMWRNARDDDVELTALLADDLEQLLGTRLSFDQVEADLREALDGGS